MPEVSEVVDARGLAAHADGRTVLVLEPTAALSLTDLDPSTFDTDEVVLVVGPEGGISPVELERLVDAGAVAVRIGSGVLRTSTAGPAAIAAVNVLLGRW